MQDWPTHNTQVIYPLFIISNTFHYTIPQCSLWYIKDYNKTGVGCTVHSHNHYCKAKGKVLGSHHNIWTQHTKVHVQGNSFMPWCHLKGCQVQTAWSTTTCCTWPQYTVGYVIMGGAYRYLHILSHIRYGNDTRIFCTACLWSPDRVDWSQHWW